MRNDDDIRKQQKKLEGVAAPLGDSSENSQLLQKLLYEEYTGTKSFMTTLYIFPKPLLSFGTCMY